MSNEDVYYGSEALRPQFKPKEEPKIDKIISDIVGKPIKVNNPKLVALIVKWKREKGDSDAPDNFLEDEAKINELRKTL